MNTEDYRKLQGLFLDPSGASRSLSRSEFIDLAWSSVGRGSKEEYGLLFDSVVVTQEHRGLLLDIDAVKEEGRVDWGGLCSFLILELSDKLKNTRTSSVPCWKPPRTLTCPHRDQVQKVFYLQSSGQYLTVSKGGTVGLRDGEDMSLLHTHRLQNSTVKPKDLWVTDMVLLHNVHKIAVSFTSKELCFYDISSKQDFNCKYKVQGLKFTPWCLDYWVDPSHPDQAVLTLGDIGGQVSALYFTSAHISLFERRRRMRMDSDSADIILWDELVKGKHRSCYTVTHQAHAPAWVRKVHYLGSLEAFVSCSTRPQSSMVIGWREKDSRSLRVTSFLTKRGVWDMDHHLGLNLIATAGVDHQVLLWNPYVNSGPVCVLSGHTGPVTAVRFMQTKQQLLSYSKDKVLCLWDISSQQCVHRLAGVFPRTQEDTHTLLFFHEERQLLLLSFNSLLLLLETMKEEKRTSSHEHPVTCVLYNSLFRQVCR
ncbi:WD repeat-containing protein 49 [Collichthys lucidus]|uniref:WD repeat-containing protein 49 n=1 Tax=Collichthys lucidus TaxID=240159 RepID=A0A4U5V0M7_COLLU|nr:WD repeat-containing protein 49 [Collichthys lucidus]